MFSTQNPLLLGFSKLISNLFNPLSSLVIYFIYFSSQHYSLKESIYLFLPILVITIIPVTIWMIWNVKTGKYSNMDVSNRQQRKSLYNFIAVSLFLYLAFEYFVRNHIDIVMLFVFVLLLLMQVSNLVIKSSMHTAFNVFVTALFYSQSRTLGYIWLFITILVALSRLILKRHTPKEVFMGAFIGSLVSIMYLYTIHYIHQ